MKIKLRPAGIMKMFVQPDDLEVKPGTTVQEVIDTLSLPEKLNILVLVDDTRRAPAEPLFEGEEVRLISLLAGG